MSSYIRTIKGNEKATSVYCSFKVQMSYLIDPFAFRLYTKYEPQHEISKNVVCATSKALDQPDIDQGFS